MSRFSNRVRVLRPDFHSFATVAGRRYMGRSERRGRSSLSDFASPPRRRQANIYIVNVVSGTNSATYHTPCPLTPRNLDRHWNASDDSWPIHRERS